MNCLVWARSSWRKKPIYDRSGIPCLSIGINALKTMLHQTDHTVYVMHEVRRLDIIVYLNCSQYPFTPPTDGHCSHATEKALTRSLSRYKPLKRTSAIALPKDAPIYDAEANTFWGIA